MTGAADPLKDPVAASIGAGDLEATFLPTFGMLGASLRFRGAELLRRIDDLAASAATGSTGGIPLLYPWANRLSSLAYKKAGTMVDLASSKPLLHFDGNGLPIHGVPWSRLSWLLLDRQPDRMAAALDWTSKERLAMFPYPHRVVMAAILQPDGLIVATTVQATPDYPVPLSFGFHPYFGLPGAERADWQLTLPPMRRLVLDVRGIPTGEEESFEGFDGPLGGRSFDDGFALLDEQETLSVSGGGVKLTLELLEGYTHAQVYAPAGKSFIALEPMTAATNALISGEGLRLLVPGEAFTAAFRIGVTTL
jgi:aldose 1-epimerase